MIFSIKSLPLSIVVFTLTTWIFFAKEKTCDTSKNNCSWLLTISLLGLKNGTILSNDKTHCVHFSRVRGIHPDPELFINQRQISISDTAHFLGVTFDKKITFLPHILNLRTKCEKSLNILKVLSNTSWGADRVSLLKIYRAITRSKIDYACQIYGSAGNSYLKKLDTVHHSALRICSGAFRTSPVISLYVDCVEPPLNFIREQLSLELYYRILSHPHHPLCTQVLTKENDLLYESRPSCIPNFGLRIRNFLSGSPLLDTKFVLGFFQIWFLGTSKTFLTWILLQISTSLTRLLIFIYPSLLFTALSITSTLISTLMVQR